MFLPARFRPVLLILLWGIALAAQPILSDLEQRLSNAKGKERAELLLQISKNYTKVFPQKGVACTEEALGLARKLGEKPLEVDALNQLAALKDSLGAYTDALQLLDQSEKLALRINYRPGLSKSYLHQSTVQERVANFDKALELTYKALRIEESIGDSGRIAACLDGLGVMHYRLKQYDQTTSAWERSLDLYVQIKDKGGEAKLLNNLGVLFKNRKEYPKALDYYGRSLKIREELGDKKGIADVYNNLAVLSMDRGELALCEQFNKKSLAMREQLGNRLAVAMSAYNLAELYRDWKRTDKGRPYLDQARTLCEQLKTRDILADCYMLESDYAAAKGDYKTALDWHQKFYKEKEGIFSKGTSDKVAEMQVRYETGRKQTEIELLRKDQAMRRVTMRFYVGALAGLAVLAALLFNRYRFKVRSQREIAKKNQDLESIDAIVRSINQQTDLKGLAQDLLDKGRFLIAQADRIGLFLLDSDRRVFQPEALLSSTPEEVASLAAIALPYDEAVERYTHHGQELEPGVFLIRDFHQLPGAKDMAHIQQPAAMLAMTLEIEGTLEGFLVLDHMTNPNAFDQPNAANLVRFREHAVSAIAKARTMARLRQEMARTEDANLKLQELNEQKTHFMGIAAHDLRAPLNSIVVSAQLLEAGTDLNEAHETARYIRQEGMEMSSLIGRFLDMDAIESGSVLPSPEPFSLCKVVQHVLTRHIRRAMEKGIDLQLMPSEDPALTFADIKFTTEIMDNLISNALKFSPSGKRVKVCLESCGEKILASIEDEGPGLNEEDLKRVFGRYAKLSAKPTAGEKSTGLGLSIVKQMVDAMDGRIWVESRPGFGATFRLELPAGTPEQHPPTPEKEPLKATENRYRGRVLLADDNRSNRFTAEKLLRTHGLSVMLVENGREALEALEKEAFDLVFLDGNMPELSGPATVAEIRRRELPSGPWAGRRQAVVALTGLTRSSDRQWLLEGGFDEVLCKPLELPLLQEILNRFLFKELPGDGPASPAMDSWAALAGALGGKVAFAEFVATALQDAESRLLNIQQALQADDRPTLSRQAHDLKSDAATLYMRELAEVCYGLEVESESLPTEELHARVARLPALMDDLKRRCADFGI